MFDANLSKEIFSQLMNGKVINETILNNSGEFVENHLYTEIIKNMEKYQDQYKMSGYVFVEKSGFFYIRDTSLGEKDLKTDITMKVCVLLLLMGKYLIENNYRLTKLTNTSGGLTEADFEAIQEMPDTQEILEKSKIKDFAYGVKTCLIDRNILLEKPSSRSYILSASGRSFFDEIIVDHQTVYDPT